MQNSIWKITALAGVIGIGFLVVLQAQRGISRPGEDLANQVQTEASAGGDQEHVGTTAGIDHRVALGEPTPPEQFEPDVQSQHSTGQPLPDQFVAQGASEQREPAHSGGHEHSDHPEEMFPDASPPNSTVNAENSQGLDFRQSADQSAPRPEADEAAVVDQVAKPDADPFAGSTDPAFENRDVGTVPPRTQSQQRTDADNPFSAENTLDEFAHPAAAEPSEQLQPFPDAELKQADAALDDGAQSSSTPARSEIIQAGHEIEQNDSSLKQDGGPASHAQNSSAGPQLLGPDLSNAPAAAANDQTNAAFATEASGSSDESGGNPFADAHEDSSATPDDEQASGLQDPPGFGVDEGRQASEMGGNANAFAPDPSAFDSSDIDVAAPDTPEPTPESAEDPREIRPFAEEPMSEEDSTGGPPQTSPLGTAIGDAAQSDSDRHHDSRASSNNGDAGDEPPSEPQLPTLPHGATGSTGEPNRLSPPPEAAKIPGAQIGDPGRRATVKSATSQGAQRPQLTIEKVAPQSAALGKPLIYQIIVTNIGSSTAHQVSVEDRVPEGAELTGTIPRAVMSNDKLMWRLGALQPGEHKKISVRVTPRKPGRIGSVATVNFVSEVAAQTLVTAPKLQLDVMAPRQAQVGQPVQFSFKVTNNGAGAAEGVILRDIIPDSLQHPSGNDLEYDVGTLPAGSSKVVHLTLTAAQTGEAVNKAIVTAVGGLKVQSQAALSIVGSRLVVSRTGPEKRYIGRTATYTNIVTNESEQPVNGATLIETVPPGLEFVEASEGGQYNQANRTVAWRIDQLGPQESRVVKVSLRAKQPGKQISRVRAVDSAGKTVEATSETVVQGFAAVGLSIPPVEGPLSVGEVVALRISARNRGTLKASDVGLTLTLPEELELVSVNAPVRYKQSEQTVEFAPLSAIPGQSQENFEIVLKARKPGDVRVGVEIRADQMQKPLSRQEAILILGDEQ